MNSWKRLISKLLEGRKTQERIVLQREFTGKIPKAGHLKI